MHVRVRNEEQRIAVHGGVTASTVIPLFDRFCMIAFSTFLNAKLKIAKTRRNVYNPTKYTSSECKSRSGYPQLGKAVSESTWYMIT